MSEYIIESDVILYRVREGVLEDMRRYLEEWEKMVLNILVKDILIVCRRDGLGIELGISEGKDDIM